MGPIADCNDNEACHNGCCVNWVQAERHARDADIQNLRQWFDQAQGQLQNTQTALTLKEQECKELTCVIEASCQSSMSKQLETSVLEAAEAMESRDTAMLSLTDNAAGLYSHSSTCRHSKKVKVSTKEQNEKIRE